MGKCSLPPALLGKRQIQIGMGVGLQHTGTRIPSLSTVSFHWPWASPGCLHICLIHENFRIHKSVVSKMVLPKLNMCPICNVYSRCRIAILTRMADAPTEGVKFTSMLEPTREKADVYACARVHVRAHIYMALS